MFERFVGQRDAASGDTAQAHRLGGTGNVTHFEIGCVEATQRPASGSRRPSSRRAPVKASDEENPA
jgi:hypothetical protein